MGKKIALGCAVVAVLLAVLLAVGFYQFVWKPGGEMVRTGVEMAKAGKDYAAGLARLGDMAELNEEIENRELWEPPADGVLTAGQVERLVAVQRRVKGEMGPRLEGFSQRYEDVSRGDRIRPSEIGDMLRDLGDLGMETKRVQVAALNEQGFSRREYSWVRRQSFLALGLGGVSLNLEEVAAAVKRGDVDEALARLEDAEETGEPLVPPENSALVEPFRDELTAWAPLAALGL